MKEKQKKICQQLAVLRCILLGLVCDKCRLFFVKPSRTHVIVETTRQVFLPHFQLVEANYLTGVKLQKYLHSFCGGGRVENIHVLNSTRVHHPNKTLRCLSWE